MAPSRARARSPERVHPDLRGNRPHCSHRPLGHRGGMFAGTPLARSGAYRSTADRRREQQASGDRLEELPRVCKGESGKAQLLELRHRRRRAHAAGLHVEGARPRHAAHLLRERGARGRRGRRRAHAAVVRRTVDRPAAHPVRRGAADCHHRPGAVSRYSRRTWPFTPSDELRRPTSFVSKPGDSTWPLASHSQCRPRCRSMDAPALAPVSDLRSGSNHT